MRREVSRHQHQAGEMWRPGSCAADGGSGARAGIESDGRLHDGIDRGHFRARAIAAAVELSWIWTGPCCWRRISRRAYGWIAASASTRR